MNRVIIENVSQYEGKSIMISGWVDSIRDHGKLVFIDLRDRSGFIQCVVKDDIENIKNIKQESVLKITGVVEERKDKVDIPYEIQVEEVSVLSPSVDLPFDVDGDLSIDTLMDYRPLTLRRKEEKSIFKVQESIVNSFRRVLTDDGFTQFQAPKITAEDAEGGAMVFKMEYFGSTATLATSPQFYKQIMVGVYERVFTIGNVYRAEKHSTSRHLNEYTSMDFELGFIDSFEDVAFFVEKFVKAAINDLKDSEIFEEYKKIHQDIDLPQIPDKIPTYTLKEVQEILEKETGNNYIGGKDLSPEEERGICEYTKKELNSDAVFVTHYPVEARPMYTYRDKENPNLTESFDLLIRGREIVTGGRRINDYNDLKNRIEEKGLSIDTFSFYLQAFKYGMPPHGGCGIGLERITAAFLGIKNVKNATLFPRDINRIDMRINK